MCIPGEKDSHSRRGCAFPVRMHHKEKHILAGNTDVTHWECTSSLGMHIPMGNRELPHQGQGCDSPGIGLGMHSGSPGMNIVIQGVGEIL